MPSNHCLCPPKQELCLPSGDCAPKKVTGSALQECSSRPETPKILVITPEFMSKNCFFADFMIKTLFFFFGLYPRINENSGNAWNEDVFLVYTLEFVKIDAFLELKTFFFVVLTSELVKILASLKMNTFFFLVFTPEFVEFGAYFAMKTFVFWSTLLNSK